MSQFLIWADIPPYSIKSYTFYKSRKPAWVAFLLSLFPQKTQSLRIIYSSSREDQKQPPSCLLVPPVNVQRNPSELPIFSCHYISAFIIKRYSPLNISSEQVSINRKNTANTLKKKKLKLKPRNKIPTKERQILKSEHRPVITSNPKCKYKSHHKYTVKTSQGNMAPLEPSRTWMFQNP